MLTSTTLPNSLVAKSILRTVERNKTSLKEDTSVDGSDTRTVDARFLGLLLMLRKELKSRGTSPILIGMSARLERIFRLHGLGFLLSPEAGK